LPLHTSLWFSQNIDYKPFTAGHSATLCLLETWNFPFALIYANSLSNFSLCWNTILGSWIINSWNSRTKEILFNLCYYPSGCCLGCWSSDRWPLKFGLCVLRGFSPLVLSLSVFCFPFVYFSLRGIVNRPAFFCYL